MTTPEALAQVLCESAPVTELYSGKDWSDLHPVERGHWIEIARAVLAHLGEGREQPKNVWHEIQCASLYPGEGRPCNCRPMDVHAECRAQAAAHAEDVRKIQVGMVELEEALRTIAATEPYGTDHREIARKALLAEMDGRSMPSAKGEQA